MPEIFFGTCLFGVTISPWKRFPCQIQGDQPNLVWLIFKHGVEHLLLLVSIETLGATILWKYWLMDLIPLRRLHISVWFEKWWYQQNPKHCRFSGPVLGVIHTIASQVMSQRQPWNLRVLNTGMISDLCWFNFFQQETRIFNLHVFLFHQFWGQLRDDWETMANGYNVV